LHGSRAETGTAATRLHRSMQREWRARVSETNTAISTEGEAVLAKVKNSLCSRAA
jgi:hypothetical protein